MDDLDHSMHIAEHEWLSFHKESEECGLPQPLLACPDNWSLCDLDDSGVGPGQDELQQDPPANSEEGESSIGGFCMEEVDQSDSGEEDDLKSKAEAKCERWVKSDINYTSVIPVGVDTRAVPPITHSTQLTQCRTVQSSDGEPSEVDGDGQTERNTSCTHEADPLSCNKGELTVNEPQSTDRAVSHVTLRMEKERWFVTVGKSPARPRAPISSMKKKRRQKQFCKNNCVRQSTGHGKPRENDLEIETNKESEAPMDSNYVTPSRNNPGEFPSAEENHESFLMLVNTELLQTSLTTGQEDELVRTNGNKHDPSSPVSNVHDILTAKGSSGSNSVESDEPGDGADFLSAHSCDSDSYLSAPESAEDPQQLLMKNRVQSSSSLSQITGLLSWTENTGDTADERVHFYCNNLFCDVASADCEGRENADVKPTLTSPSAAQSVKKMPDENSVCENGPHCAALGVPLVTHGPPKNEINLSSSVCSSGDQLSLPTIPDVTLTPCSVADSPETYAAAVGHTQSLYAISAFWDEMEKLTINDILQLRTGKSATPRDAHKSPYVNSPTNHSSLVDTVECNLSEGGLLDTSDTSDSDYFTQLDESKPDRSSCEFSTSDFEEEYCQFCGTSGNRSPGPQNTNQPRKYDSPFLAHEEEESTASDGNETPVPAGDFPEEDFEDQYSGDFISSSLVWPRPITKSKSVNNISALKTGDLSLPDDDESDVVSPLEEIVPVQASDSLETQILFLSNADTLENQTEMPFSEYIFTENKANRDSAIIYYDPEDISVAPVMDYTLCTFRNETSFAFFHHSQDSEEETIPIFSYSRPTREFTFPHYVFLSAACNEKDGISPLRAHSLMQVSDGGMSAVTPRGFQCWQNLLSMRKISFHDKGSIWCRGSAPWVFPVDAEMIAIRRADPPVTVVTDGQIPLAPPQLCQEIAEQQICKTMAIRRKSQLSRITQYIKK